MALKPCRECGKEISTEATACPNCGVSKPTGGSGLGCGAVLLIVVGLGIAVSLLPKPEKTPEEKAKDEATQKAADAKQQADKEAFDHDYRALVGAGILVVSSGNAEKYEISGWNSSLDLYLRDRSNLKASALSDYLCRQKYSLMGNNWKVRIYLADGTVGAQCKVY
jgi:hypothetical protein